MDTPWRVLIEDKINHFGRMSETSKSNIHSDICGKSARLFAAPEVLNRFSGSIFRMLSINALLIAGKFFLTSDVSTTDESKNWKY